MATPALRAIHRRFPAARLAVAGRPAMCELLQGLPWIQEFQPFPARPGPRALLQVGRKLALHAEDLCVVLPHSFRAALLARIARSRLRLGYARGGRSALLNLKVAPNKHHGRIAPLYTAREYLHLVEALGCTDDGQGLELAVDPPILEAMQRRLGEGGPLVGFAPGAAFGPSKCWLPERYAAVADALYREYGARNVLLTGPGEEATRDKILGAAQTPLLDPYEAGGSIAQLKAAVASLDLMIGNDSGPRHLAIAFKKPMICIMGPTAPAYTASPWEVGRVLRVEVECGPCQKPVCVTDHRCMTRISVEDVVDAARAHLPRRAAGARTDAREVERT